MDGVLQKNIEQAVLARPFGSALPGTRLQGMNSMPCSPLHHAYDRTARDDLLAVSIALYPSAV